MSWSILSSEKVTNICLSVAGSGMRHLLSQAQGHRTLSAAWGYLTRPGPRLARGARGPDALFYAERVDLSFGRRVTRPENPRLSGRGEKKPTTKMDISDLTPSVLHFLGQAAYCELGAFGALARAVDTAPSLSAKEGLSTAAGRALAKHHGLVAEIRRRDRDPAVEMAPFAPAADSFRTQTQGADWYELLLSCYLTNGLLDDFFVRLSDGLPHDVGSRVAHVLAEDAGTDVLVHHLQAAITAQPGLESRLALWGRRLVGDTLLVARSAMPASDPSTAGLNSSPELRIEPVFTELIAAHTRRMDGLGLTA